MNLRDYQQKAVDDLFGFLGNHKDHGLSAPLIVLPTGSGKSVVCAAIIKRMWDEHPELQVNCLVLVPSKELLEQNFAHIKRACDDLGISCGMYSASVNRREADRQVVVATIGSIWKKADELSGIRLVIADEAHLIKTEADGMYRSLMSDLSAREKIITVGMTATPFRGNGVHLCEGKEPYFDAVCHETRIEKLIEDGYLSPLVPPAEDVKTKIDSSKLQITATGDYRGEDMQREVSAAMRGIVTDTISIASNRKKWIAFCPLVESAHEMSVAFNAMGINAAVVTGMTPAADRERIIASFRAGEIRCLVSVLALTTGFDVPDIDCIVWARPCLSPVLYIQGAGRGTRIADGKTNCLWLDFTDTTSRLGPINMIRGRKFREAEGGSTEVTRECDSCGAEYAPASLMTCPVCGAEQQTIEAEMVEKEPPQVSTADIIASSHNMRFRNFSVTHMSFDWYQKKPKPPLMRVSYFCASRSDRPIATEWVCLDHPAGTFPRKKADQWWLANTRDDEVPANLSEALKVIESRFLYPAMITLDMSERYPTITSKEY